MRNRILVVDDNSNNLLLERDLLELAGFEVLEAMTALEGMDLAVRERPDLIIMDVRLPDMRGSEAAKLLRQRAETRGIPIVFVTASVMPEGRAEITSIPNSGFIGKPIDTRAFAAQIAGYLRA